MLYFYENRIKNEKGDEVKRQIPHYRADIFNQAHIPVLFVTRSNNDIEIYIDNENNLFQHIFDARVFLEQIT